MDTTGTLKSLHDMDFQEGKQEILRRWVWGGLTGIEKIKVLDGEFMRGGCEQLF